MKSNFLFYLIIGLLICLSTYLIYYINTESFDCISNPLVYGVSNLRSSNKEEITCSCSFAGSGQILIINKDGMKLDNIEGSDINFKDLYKK